MYVLNQSLNSITLLGIALVVFTAIFAASTKESISASLEESFPGDLTVAAANPFIFVLHASLGAVGDALVWLVLGAMWFCGLSSVTSNSRMLFAFARDGGLPWSRALARVSAQHRVPAVAIWTSALLAIALTVYTPVYVTITIVCVIFLYISYVLPTLLGIFTYGRSWTRRGPFDVGRWYRPLAVLCVLWCGVLIAIGMQPPYDLAIRIVAATLVVMAVVWFGFEKKRFAGPPLALSASGGDAR